MPRMPPRLTALLAVTACLFCPAPARPAEPAADSIRIAQGQNITIGLIAGDAGSTDTRVAAEIGQVVDDGDKLRILPMLGRGPVQNIADLIYLKGIDIAIVQTDALDQTMQRNAIPKENSIQYVTKLFQEEVHVLASGNVASLNDLNGRTVAAGPAGSGTALAAAALLNLSHVSPTLIHDSQAAALDRLRHGDIAAMFVVGGEPVPLLQAIEPGSGLRLLPIPLTAQLVDAYLPGSLDHQNYPNLIPPGPAIDTVAVSSALITMAAPADSLRAKRVNRFVDTLFERFAQFRRPGFHPKWQEVNLSVQVPGWTRYPEAQLLLKKEQPGDSSLGTAFGTYLVQSGQKLSGLPDERRQELFRDFLRWRDHSAP